MSLVVAENVTMQFGGLKAVSGVDLHLEEGEIVALIGPNGAGKTTFFNMLTGIYTPTEGTLHYLGESVGGMAPDVICDKGIARTFQNIRLFANMTALENVMMGRHVRTKQGPFAAMFRTPAFKAEERQIVEDAAKYLDFVGLLDRADELAKNLPYGEQRRLEIARALASEPRLLLLDEPAAGMNPQESGMLTELIRKIRDTGLTVLLIEHDMKVVMGLADRIYVLDFGQLIAEGCASDIQNNTRVIEAYLGKEAAQALIDAREAEEAAVASSSDGIIVLEEEIVIIEEVVEFEEVDE